MSTETEKNIETSVEKLEKNIDKLLNVVSKLQERVIELEDVINERERMYIVMYLSVSKFKEADELQEYLSSVAGFFENHSLANGYTHFIVPVEAENSRIELLNPKYLSDEDKSELQDKFKTIKGDILGNDLFEQDSE